MRACVPHVAFTALREKCLHRRTSCRYIPDATALRVALSHPSAGMTDDAMHATGCAPWMGTRRWAWRAVRVQPERVRRTAISVSHFQRPKGAHTCPTIAQRFAQTHCPGLQRFRCLVGNLSFMASLSKYWWSPSAPNLLDSHHDGCLNMNEQSCRAFC